MKVSEARLCLNDDEIFVGEICPACGQDCAVPIRAWIKPMRRQDHGVLQRLIDGHAYKPHSVVSDD